MARLELRADGWRGGGVGRWRGGRGEDVRCRGGRGIAIEAGSPDDGEDGGEEDDSGGVADEPAGGEDVGIRAGRAWRWRGPLDVDRPASAPVARPLGGR